MRLCPSCHSETVLLLATVSRASPFNHYTCSLCGEAWTSPKTFEKNDADDEEDDDVVH